MSNAFDQFDSKNAFDQFDPAPPLGSAQRYPTPADRDPPAGAPRLKFGERVGKEWARWTNPENWQKTRATADAVTEGAAQTPSMDPGAFLTGTADAATTALKNAVVGPASGLAGLGTVAAKSLRALGPGYTMQQALNEGADTVRAVQDKYGVHAKTPLGRALVSLMAAPVNVSSDVAGNIGESIGSMAGNEAAGRTLGEAAPGMALGLDALRSWKQTPFPKKAAAEGAEEEGGLTMAQKVKIVKATAKILGKVLGGP